MQIKFTGDHKYYADWAIDQQNKGFVLGLADVEKTLLVSRSWIHTVLMKAVPYCRYTSKMIKATVPGTEFYSDAVPNYIYFSAAEINKWIRETATFTRRTLVVNFVDFYDEDYLKKIYDQGEKEAADEIYAKFGIHKTPSPQVVYMYMTPLLGFGEDVSIYYRERSKVPVVKIKPFDVIGNEKIELLFPKTMYHNSELAYRHAFDAGFIKVSIGNQKTIFIKQKNEEEKEMGYGRLSYQSYLAAQAAGTFPSLLKSKK